MELYILIIFTVMNTGFIILNISLIMHYKLWANQKNKEYIELITDMKEDTEAVLSELRNTKEALVGLKDLIKKATT